MHFFSIFVAAMALNPALASFSESEGALFVRVEGPVPAGLTKREAEW